MEPIALGHPFTTLVSNRYRNLQKLGSGGNSDVYLVVAESGVNEGILFALKVFKKIKDPIRAKRFQVEYAYLSKTPPHPAIMRVYDTGFVMIRENGNEYEVPFGVAEYLPTTLDHQIFSGASHIEKVSYAYQLISALNHIHTQNPPVIHRDIKPKNIFINGRSCLLGDFGLVKFLHREDDYDGDIYIDTVGPTMPANYRTPDLVNYANKRGKLTVKTDIFQLGLVLAELFTKENPCKQKGASTIYDPVKLKEIKEIPGETGVPINQALVKMLKENPDERPSAQELLDIWKSIFLRVVKQSQDIDGRAFA